jgi:hypothetical protein
MEIIYGEVVEDLPVSMDQIKGNHKALKLFESGVCRYEDAKGQAEVLAMRFGATSIQAVALREKAERIQDETRKGIEAILYGRI